MKQLLEVAKLLDYEEINYNAVWDKGELVSIHIRNKEFIDYWIDSNIDNYFSTDQIISFQPLEHIIEYLEKKYDNQLSAMMWDGVITITKFEEDNDIE